jgi:hypothetical protein
MPLSLNECPLLFMAAENNPQVLAPKSTLSQGEMEQAVA